jgi:hypothetical protein
MRGENGSDGLGLNFVQIELTDPQITLRNRTMPFRKLLYPYDSGRVSLRLVRSQNPPRATSWGFAPLVPAAFQGEDVLAYEARNRDDAAIQPAPQPRTPAPKSAPNNPGMAS